MLALIPRNLVQSTQRVVFDDANRAGLEDTGLGFVLVRHDIGVLSMGYELKQVD
jgi:hypothetical protein